ncbi:serine protease [Verrucomicrobiales bacterium BCK34]|nr:serine protease [Verrucomicrobiales bacterium BCK34]
MNFIINVNHVVAVAAMASCLNLVASDEIDLLERKVERAVEEFSGSCYGVRALDGGWGSAVLISAEGRFLSSAHVFQFVGESITVHQVGGPEISARVVRLDRELDIALLEAADFRVRGKEVKVVSLSSGARIDEPVEALAFGHASGFRRERRAPLRFGFVYENAEGDLISNCRLTIGDSGGALLNLEGELIGIHRTVDRKWGSATHVSLAAIFDRWPDMKKSDS